jgi:hypothetical protein
LALYYINNRIAFKLKRSPVMSTITVTVSGGQGGLADLAQPNWQLLGNENQVGLTDLAFVSQTEVAFPGTYDDAQRFVDARRSGDAATMTEIQDGQDPAAVTTFDFLVDKLSRGETHIPVGQYVLKRTMSISNFYTGPLDVDGSVESIWSTGEILTLPMPPRMAVKINSIPIPSFPAPYVWGWRQLPSTEVTGAQNRIDVSTEWWLAAYDTRIYALR